MPDGAPMARVKAMPAGSMGADSPGTQVDERVAPEEGDIIVHKSRVGAFGTTDLDQQLRARGVDTLVLAGISTAASCSPRSSTRTAPTTGARPGRRDRRPRPRAHFS